MYIAITKNDEARTVLEYWMLNFAPTDPVAQLERKFKTAGKPYCARFAQIGEDGIETVRQILAHRFRSMTQMLDFAAIYEFEETGDAPKTKSTSLFAISSGCGLMTAGISSRRPNEDIYTVEVRPRTTVFRTDNGKLAREIMERMDAEALAYTEVYATDDKVYISLKAKPGEAKITTKMKNGINTLLYESIAD